MIQALDSSPCPVAFFETYLINYYLVLHFIEILILEL